MAATGTRLVLDLRRRGQLQVHRPAFRVALIGEDVDKVGLDGSGRDFEDGNQVRFVLKKQSGLVTGSRVRSVQTVMTWNVF